MAARRQILCVDDEADIRRILSVALEFSLGADVVEVGSGVEALAALAAGTAAPDLIILDGSMPGMDGYALCRRLREEPRLSNTPIFFLTAAASAESVERAQAAGANACLAKPFDPMTVGEEIAQLLSW